MQPCRMEGFLGADGLILKMPACRRHFPRVGALEGEDRLFFIADGKNGPRLQAFRVAGEKRASQRLELIFRMISNPG